MDETKKKGRGRGGGPSTTEGKLASSRNAAKDRIWASWLDEDEQAQCDALVIDFLAEYDGESATVRLLVERLANVTIKLRRVQRVEDSLFQKARIFQQYLAKTPHGNSLAEKISHATDMRPDLAEEWAVELNTAAAMPDSHRMTLLARYESSLERQMFRWLQALKVLKDESSAQSVLPVEVNAVRSITSIKK